MQIHILPIGLLIACTAACGHGAGSHEASTVTANGSQQATAKSGTGNTECDEYVRLVTRCIETKMPESDKADRRQDLDRVRKAIADSRSPAIRTPDLEAWCTDRIRTTIQGDTYSCYGDEAQKRGIQTACTLVMRSELSDLLKAPVEEGVQDGYDCRYVFAGGVAREPFKIILYLKGGRDQLEAARSAQPWMNDAAKHLPLPKDGDFVSGTTVAGLGDDAFVTAVGGTWPRLVARRDEMAIELFGGSGEQLVAIARKALPRLQVDPTQARTSADEKR